MTGMSKVILMCRQKAASEESGWLLYELQHPALLQPQQNSVAEGVHLQIAVPAVNVTASSHQMKQAASYTRLCDSHEAQHHVWHLQHLYAGCLLPSACSFVEAWQLVPESRGLNVKQS